MPSTTRNNEANKLVRTNENGYLMTGYINSNTAASENPSISQFITDNSDGYYRKSSTDHASKAIFNARVRDASWTWVDDYIALPLSTVQWGVFAPRAAQATITSVVCWDDAGNAVIQLRRNDGGDMINGGLACNGTASTNLNANNVIPVGYFVGMWASAGTAKRIAVGITYTTAY